LWGFGDGITSTLTSPTHTYTAAGVYTVTLTVSDGIDTSTITRPDYITVRYSVYLPLVLRNH
jgi:PKD repeat protein